MAAMIGTRNEQDLVMMLDARSEYGRALKRDYFKPKSEVDCPTGVLLKCYVVVCQLLFLVLRFLILCPHQLGFFSCVSRLRFLSCGCTI